MSHNEIDPYIPNERIEENLKPLIDHLIERYAIKDRDRLTNILWESWLPYGGGKMSAAQAENRPPDSLHDMAEPLAKVVALLGNDTNFSHLISALQVDESGGNSQKIAMWLINLESALRRILAVIPKPPRRPRGRPPTRDLPHLVHKLAAGWCELTGKPFTQDWLKNKPVAKPVGFVYDVVKFLDKSALPQLPTVTKNVVSERRRRAAILLSKNR